MQMNNEWNWSVFFWEEGSKVVFMIIFLSKQEIFDDVQLTLKITSESTSLRIPCVF